MNCPKCGNALKQGAKFCPKCGANLMGGQARPAHAEQGSYSCPACGAEARHETRFCGVCGNPISGPRVSSGTPGKVAPTCSSCGATLPEGKRFCGKCGAPVVSSLPVPTAIQTRVVEPVLPYLSPTSVPPPAPVPSFDFEKAGNKGKMPILMITAVAGGVVLIAACAVAAWFLLARPAALKPANGEPQSLPPRQQKNAPNQEANRTSSDIRHVDFRNFTYATSISDRKCYGLPATIQVRNGEFKAGQGDQEAYFSVGGIRYGDLTGDGREEAVVNTGCGMSTGNAWTDDFYAYAVRNGQVENLGSFGSDEMERDYLRYYPNGGLWRVDSFKVTSGKLIIECYADGSHAAPQYMATLEYRWNGQAFVLNGSPQKRRLPLPAAESPVSRGPKKGDFVAWDKLDEKPKRLSDLSVVYPPEAAQNQVRGTADLEINIDETGRVTSVNILSGPVPDYGLNDACVKAAKAVSYMPAVKAGVPVKTRQEYLIALTPPPPPVAPKPVTPAASSLGVIIEAKANLGRFQLLVDQQVVWDSSLMGHLGEIKRATKEFQVPPGTHKLDFQAWMPNATQPVSSASWGYTAAQGERHILKFYVTIFGNTKWQIVQ